MYLSWNRLAAAVASLLLGGACEYDRDTVADGYYGALPAGSSGSLTRPAAAPRSQQPTAAGRSAPSAALATPLMLALTTALSAFEWLMSLSPEYASTMFGANWIAVCLFGGEATTLVLTGLAQRSETPLPAPGPAHYSALGRLLFAYLFFLGYTEFFQFMLGWIGDRPSEAIWRCSRWRRSR